MNIINYILLAIILFIVELVYLKIAKKYKIIDNPNNRSSHSTPTIRGGGIIIFIAFVLYGLWFKKIEPPYSYLIAAIGLVALISFIDDMISLSSKLRILIHVVSFSLLFFALGIFNSYSIIGIGFIYIVSLCFLNIYNFMDGINGITFLNSLATYSILLALNIYYIPFTDTTLLIILTIATLVFGFFNFRNKPTCFAGDIGSITIGLSIIFFVLSFYIQTNNPLIFLILSAYIIDGGLTILQRLFSKENIFKPHKKHLYQVLANDLKINHLVVSSGYFLFQSIVNSITYVLVTKEYTSVFLVLLPMGCISVIYIVIKFKILKTLA